MPGAFAHMVAADRAKQAAESQGLHLIARSTLKYPRWLQVGTDGQTIHIWQVQRLIWTTCRCRINWR